MNDKIKQALKTKYPNLGLGEKTFDGVAEMLSKTITEESQIETSVAGAEGFLKLFQSEADRRVTDLRQKNLELESENAKLKNEPPKPTGTSSGGEGAEEPAWKKEIEELKQQLKDREANADKALKDRSLKDSAKKLMMEKGVSEKLCDEILANHNISETDTAEVISEQGIQKYNFIKTEIAPEAGQPRTPQGGTSDSDLDDYFKNKKAKNEAEAKLVEDLKAKAQV